MTLDRQLVGLVVLAIPIASVAWTVTREAVFREPRDWCVAKSKSCRRALSRNVVVLLSTRDTLLFDGWRRHGRKATLAP